MNNKGFSLVELLVVIAISAIIVGMSALSYSLINSRNTEKAAETFEKCLNEARTVSMAKGTSVGCMVLSYQNNSLICTINGDVTEICKNAITVNDGLGHPLGNNTTINFNTAGQITSIGSNHGRDIYFLRNNVGYHVQLNGFSGKAVITGYH